MSLQSSAAYNVVAREYQAAYTCQQRTVSCGGIRAPTSCANEGGCCGGVQACLESIHVHISQVVWTDDDIQAAALAEQQLFFANKLVDLETTMFLAPVGTPFPSSISNGAEEVLFLLRRCRCCFTLRVVRRGHSC